MVHGFSESSDTWFEPAIVYALNGIVCHMIDLECFGYSAGIKGPGLRIENMHFNITALIMQFKEGLTTFLMGHSMCCMVINTFLLRNPDLKIAGVIFSAPFFGISESFHWNWGRH